MEKSGLPPRSCFEFGVHLEFDRSGINCFLDVMDLLDFNTTRLYYEQAPAPEIELLLKKASADYAAGTAEWFLKLAWSQAPRNLTVLVALYRFYYYSQRLEEALEVAEQAVSAAGDQLALPTDWRDLCAAMLDKESVPQAMGLVRFYLLAVKGAAVLCLRLGRLEEAIERLRKLAELDANDHLAVRELLQLALGRIEADPITENSQTH